ncbi:MAG: type II secretion system protein [Candidatus Omnitrophica bacterium]|nr:type II secretion system protein [Candidatus Omnitrophota bacterium]
MSKQKTRTKGFSLVELVIAVAILSIGIIFVLQAFSFSIKATAVSCDMMEAAACAKDILQELQFKETGKLIQKEPNTVKNSKGKFSWVYKLDLDNDTNLYKLNLNITWQTQKRNESLSVNTLLK